MIREVKIAIWISGDPVSLVPRWYVPISSCFRSFVIVIGYRDFSTSVGHVCLSEAHSSYRVCQELPTTGYNYYTTERLSVSITRFLCNRGDAAITPKAR